MFTVCYGKSPMSTIELWAMASSSQTLRLNYQRVFKYQGRALLFWESKMAPSRHLSTSRSLRVLEAGMKLNRREHFLDDHHVDRNCYFFCATKKVILNQLPPKKVCRVIGTGKSIGKKNVCIG